MHWYDNGWHMGWMWIWWIIGLVLLIVGVWVVVTLVRRSGGPPPPSQPGQQRDSAEDELKRRYARGEIDKETYEQMLDDLRR